MSKFALEVLGLVGITAAAPAGLTIAIDVINVRIGGLGGFIWETTCGELQDFTRAQPNLFPGDLDDYEEALNKDVVKRVTLSTYARPDYGSGTKP